MCIAVVGHRKIRYDTYRIFYIPVNELCYQFINFYMRHTGQKECKKEIKKKKTKKNKVTIKIASRGFKPGPSESARTKS